MVITIPIEVKRNNESISTSALVNSGYESEQPEIHIPLALARRLGFKLEYVRSEKYKVVGAEVSTYIIGEVYVRINTEDRVTEWIRSRAVCVLGEYEVIISDSLAEELGIELIKPKKGLWRLHGENTLRESAEPHYWID